MGSVSKWLKHNTLGSWIGLYGKKKNNNLAQVSAIQEQNRKLEEAKIDSSGRRRALYETEGGAMGDPVLDVERKRRGNIFGN